MALLPELTIPTAEEISHVLLQPPYHHHREKDIEDFLRALHETYPHSRLLVSSPATLIETNAHTGVRVRFHGHLAIIERLDAASENARYIVQLLGGPTGFEHFYITDVAHFAESGQNGWSACAGTSGRWSACYVIPSSMIQAYDLFMRAFLQGPQVKYPTPLTDEERRIRQERAKLGFLASLRRTNTIASS